MQVCPLQLPAASQRQVLSPVGHEHVAVVLGGVVPPAVLPAVPVIAVPAEAQPQPTHVTSQRCPEGQSASIAHLGCCGWQVQGPPHGSVPAQTVVSPALHVGIVHPQLTPDAGVDGGVAAPHAH